MPYRGLSRFRSGVVVVQWGYIGTAVMSRPHRSTLNVRLEPVKRYGEYPGF